MNTKDDVGYLVKVMMGGEEAEKKRRTALRGKEGDVKEKKFWSCRGRSVLRIRLECGCRSEFRGNWRPASLRG